MIDRKFIFQIAFLLSVLLLSKATSASDTSDSSVHWPVGMSFVGLTDQTWQLYIVPKRNQGPVRVVTESEPRTPVYSPTLNVVIYISASGDIIHHNLASGDSSVLLSVMPNVAYTQPFLSPDRQSVIVVRLEQARSQRTSILEIDLKSKKTSTISQQRTAQFEPYVRNDLLYYTNVLCIENCAGRYVHEIWEKNLISNDARQLTMLNAETHQPVVSKDNDMLIVSSEKSGPSRVWRCLLNVDPPLDCSVIDADSVADTSPVVDNLGRLFLLRLMQDDTQQIVHIVDSNSAVTMPLALDVTRIRDLEIGL